MLHDHHAYPTEYNKHIKFANSTSFLMFAFTQTQNLTPIFTQTQNLAPIAKMASKVGIRKPKTLTHSLIAIKKYKYGC
jgi:hypothetical protein